MKNKLYKLLVIREQGGNWQKYLENIQLTLMGFKMTPELLIVLGRISTLRFLEMQYFRNTIFDLMEIIDKVELEVE
jgi:hypothetical protein